MGDSWRFWSKTNPCPACSGHGRAGKSAQQCRGGYDPARSEVRIWCSTEDSGTPSRAGSKWEWHLDEPYPWESEPSRSDTSRRPHRGPGLCYAPADEPLPHWLAGTHKVAGRWVYRAFDGAYVFEVVRSERSRPSGDRDKVYTPGSRAYEGATLIQWGLPPRELLVPYRLPELRRGIAAGQPVYVSEGEKSCDALAALGQVATTCQGGSNAWGATPDVHRWFEGARDATIIVDRDTAGARWARDVVASLALIGITPRLVRSRTTREGDDIVDHLGAGHALAELEPFTLT